ncbi:hypothetical protein DFQ26_004768 [Actinomortierella ambigua]|nr:hypothetical protein DFQ26_004768 [Actinomortierella ambigua]
MNDMTGHFLYRVEYEGVGSQLTNLRRVLSSADKSFRVTISRTVGQDTTPVPASLSLSSVHNNTTAPADYLHIVVKSKPIDTALIELTNIMAQLQGGEFAEEYDAVKDMTGFRNSHIREIELAELAWKVGGAMERISTKVYNVMRNDSQQLYALCLEYLDPATGTISHMNSTDAALSTWSSQDIHTVLRDVADFHAQFLGADSMLLNELSFLENPSRNLMQSLRSTYEAMADTNHRNNSTLFDETLTDAIKSYLKHSNSYWSLLERSPRTLRDVVEFLAFVLPPGSKEWSHYIEYHRLALRSSLERLRHHSADHGMSTSTSTTTITMQQPLWRQDDIRFPTQREYLDVAKVALMDFASLRLSMIGISNSFKTVSWLPRILDSVRSQILMMGPLRPELDKVVSASRI